MLKKFKLISVFTLLINSVYGQQDALLNFASFAEMYNNPANVVNTDVWSASTYYKNSLPGFQNGPVSYYLQVGGPFNVNRGGKASFTTAQEFNKIPNDLGFGAYILNDSYGFYNYNSVMINYAQRFQIAYKKYISFGLGIGLFNYSIDKNNLNVSNENDPELNKYLNHEGNYNLGDANFGFIYHSTKIQFGISSNHLLKNTLKFGNTAEFAELNRSYNAFLKYKYEINKDVMFIPNLMLNKQTNLPINIQLSIPFVYQEFLMSGLSYNYNKNITVDFGIYYQQIFFGYSFSLNTSKISAISNTSHSIGLKYVLPIWSSFYNDYSINKDLF